MYYMMHCFSPKDGELAMLSYTPDDPLRCWADGARFDDPPPEPVRAEVKAGHRGVMAEFWDDPVPLMTKRMYVALKEAGVTNLDTYRAEIHDPETNVTYDDYVAFNVVGQVAAADLARSKHDPSVPWFDSVALNEAATCGALLFRLAESVNAIVVHEKVKQHLQAAGIDTLTFVSPDQWAG